MVDAYELQGQLSNFPQLFLIDPTVLTPEWQLV